MDLDQFSENWKKECADIKKRPQLYIFKLTALIFFGISYYIIISPLLVNIEGHVKQIGVAGMYLITGTVVLQKLIPSPILTLCNGEIICQVDNIKDMRRLNLFYILVLPCAYLLVMFTRQVKELLVELYGNRNATK